MQNQDKIKNLDPITRLLNDFVVKWAPKFEEVYQMRGSLRERDRAYFAVFDEIEKK
jgi:hypothetical protein